MARKLSSFIRNVFTVIEAPTTGVEATKLATARTIALSGDVSGSTSFDGSANATITATVADDSHNHVISNVDGLQTALDGKSATSHTHSNATTSASGFMSNTDKSKLDGIAAGANNYTYTLPNAASTVTGGVRVRLNGTTAYFTNNGTTA